MTTLDSVKRKIQEELPRLRIEYKIDSIGIFGSFIKGKNRKNSDLDILIDFNYAVTFFRFLRLEEKLSEITSRRVDLVMKSALKPKIGEYILKYVIYFNNDFYIK